MLLEDMWRNLHTEEGVEEFWHQATVLLFARYFTDMLVQSSLNFGESEFRRLFLQSSNGKKKKKVEKTIVF